MAINGLSAISSVIPISNVVASTSTIPQAENTDSSFSNFLTDSLNKLNESQLYSQRLTDDFAAGKIDNIHQVMIAAEKADIALQFTMQIRNKILDAYNEIMRMQV